MTSGGGFAGNRFELIEVPAFTLFGNNTVIFRPGTVLDSGDPPPLVEARMSVEQVDALLEYALGPGHLADARAEYLDFADRIADAPTTTFDVHAAGLDKRVSVYALGIGTPPAGPAGADLRGLQELAELLATFDRQVEAGQVLSSAPYDPRLYRAVLVEGGPIEGAIAWPWPELSLEDFPPLAEASAIRVGSLTPEQVALLTTVPSGGSYGMPLIGPDGLGYTLQYRPLLPGDEVRPDEPQPSATTNPGPPANPGTSALPIYPLPEGLTDMPEPLIEVEPTSGPGPDPGVVFPFTLEHCGLGSPVDVDGSLWDPTGGIDAQGGPIDTDAEIGDLINPTEGEAVLVGEDRLDFRTPLGVVVVFTRHEGAKGYPACM
jgi:hypothetical protein